MQKLLRWDCYYPYLQDADAYTPGFRKYAIFVTGLFLDLLYTMAAVQQIS
jgi:hypothetical protein